MDRERIALADMLVLQDRLVLLEQVGPHALPGCISHVKGEFYAFNIKARPNARVMEPLFCYGPFYNDRENREIPWRAPLPRTDYWVRGKCCRLHYIISRF